MTVVMEQGQKVSSPVPSLPGAVTGVAAPDVPSTDSEPYVGAANRTNADGSLPPGGGRAVQSRTSADKRIQPLSQSARAAESWGGLAYAPIPGPQYAQSTPATPLSYSSGRWRRDFGESVGRDVTLCGTATSQSNSSQQEPPPQGVWAQGPGKDDGDNPSQALGRIAARVSSFSLRPGAPLENNSLGPRRYVRRNGSTGNLDGLYAARLEKVSQLVTAPGAPRPPRVLGGTQPVYTPEFRRSSHSHRVFTGRPPLTGREPFGRGRCGGATMGVAGLISSATVSSGGTAASANRALQPSWTLYRKPLTGAANGSSDCLPSTLVDGNRGSSLAHAKGNSAPAQNTPTVLTGMRVSSEIGTHTRQLWGRGVSPKNDSEIFTEETKGTTAPPGLTAAEADEAFLTLLRHQRESRTRRRAQPATESDLTSQRILFCRHEVSSSSWRPVPYGARAEDRLLKGHPPSATDLAGGPGVGAADEGGGGFSGRSRGDRANIERSDLLRPQASGQVPGVSGVEKANGALTCLSKLRPRENLSGSWQSRRVGERPQPPTGGRVHGEVIKSADPAVSNDSGGALLSRAGAMVGSQVKPDPDSWAFSKQRMDGEIGQRTRQATRATASSCVNFPRRVYAGGQAVWFTPGSDRLPIRTLPVNAQRVCGRDDSWLPKRQSLTSVVSTNRAYPREKNTKTVRNSNAVVPGCGRAAPRGPARDASGKLPQFRSTDTPQPSSAFSSPKSPCRRLPGGRAALSLTAGTSPEQNRRQDKSGQEYRTFILRSILRRARALHPKATHLKVFLLNHGTTDTALGQSHSHSVVVSGVDGKAELLKEEAQGDRLMSTFRSDSGPADSEFLQLVGGRHAISPSLCECRGQQFRHQASTEFPTGLSSEVTGSPGVLSVLDGVSVGNPPSWGSTDCVRLHPTADKSVERSGLSGLRRSACVALNAEGCRQAVAAAKLLRDVRFTMIYCSDDAPCQEMKSMILTLNRHSPYVDDCRLNDRDRGELAGLSNTDFVKRANRAGCTKETFRPRGGESLEDVRERAVVFFVEALVGEFLLSVDLRDFVAEAAADERRAVAVANRLAPSPDNAGVPGSSCSPAPLSEPSLPCANNVEAQEGVSNSKLGPSNHTTSPAQALFSLQSEREDTKAYPRQQRAFGDGIAEMSNDVKDAASSGVGTEQEMNRRHLVAQSDLAVDDPARQEREMRLDKWIGRPAKVLAGSDELTDSSLSFLSPSVNLVFGGTLDVAVEAPSAASTAVATDAKTRGFASLFSLDVTGSDCSSSSASAEERNPSLESDSSPTRATESNGVGVSHGLPAGQVSDPVSMRASVVEECEADWHCQSEHVMLANIEMSVASADDDENDGDVTTVSSPSARGSYTLVKPTIQGASVSPILSAPGPVHKGQTSVLPENHPLREADSHSNDSLQSSPTTHSTAALFSVASVSGPVTDGLQELHAPGTGSHTHVTSSYDTPLPAGFPASFSEAASEDGVREGGAVPAGGRRPKRRRRRKGKSQTGGDVDDDGGPRDAAGQDATTRKKSGSWFSPAAQRSGGEQTEAAREASHTADHLEEMEFASVASCGASTVYQDGVAMGDEAEDDPGRARCCVGPVAQMPFSDGEAEPNTRYHGAISPGTRSDCDGEKMYSTARRKRRGASAVGTCLRSGWSAAQARSEGTGICLRYSKAQLPHPQSSLSFDAKVTSDFRWLRLKSSNGFCRVEEYWSLFAHSRFGQGEEEDEVVQSLRRSQQAKKRVESGGPPSPVTSSDGENKTGRNCPTGDACYRAQTDELSRPSVQVKDLRLPFTLCKLPDKTSGSFLSPERRAEFTKFIFFENSPDRLPLTEEETGVDQGSTSCTTKSSGPAASSGTDKQSEHQQRQGQEMLVTSQDTETESRKPEPKMGILCRSAHEMPEEYGSVGVRSSAAGVCDSVRTPTPKHRKWVWPALQEGERVQRQRRSRPCGNTLPHRSGNGTAGEQGGGSNGRLVRCHDSQQHSWRTSDSGHDYPVKKGSGDETATRRNPARSVDATEAHGWQEAANEVSRALAQEQSVTADREPRMTPNRIEVVEADVGIGPVSLTSSNRGKYRRSSHVATASRRVSSSPPWLAWPDPGHGTPHPVSPVGDTRAAPLRRNRTDRFTQGDPPCTPRATSDATEGDFSNRDGTPAHILERRLGGSSVSQDWRRLAAVLPWPALLRRESGSRKSTSAGLLMHAGAGQDPRRRAGPYGGTDRRHEGEKKGVGGARVHDERRSAAESTHLVSKSARTERRGFSRPPCYLLETEGKQRKRCESAPVQGSSHGWQTAGASSKGERGFRALVEDGNCEATCGVYCIQMTNKKVRGGHMEINCVGAEASLLDACDHTEGRVGGRTAEPEDQGSCHSEWRMNGDASSDGGRASLSNRERRGIPGGKRDDPLVLHNRRRRFSWSAGGQAFTEASWSCSTRVPPETHSVTSTVTLSATKKGRTQAPSEDPAFWTSLGFPQGVRTPNCTSEMRAHSNAAASTNRKHRSRAASAEAIMGSHVIAPFPETQARDPDATQLADSPQIQLLSHRRCRAELVTENVRRLFSSRKRYHRSVQPGHGRTERGPQEMPCPSGDGSLKLPVMFAGLLNLVSGFARTCMPVAGAPARRADEGLSECTGSRSTVAAESCQLLLPQDGHSTGEWERIPPAVVQAGDQSPQENARSLFAAPASCTLPDTAMVATPNVNPLCMWSLGLLRVLGKECKEWSESCVTSLVGRPRKSRHTQKTQTSDGVSVIGSRVSVTTDTEANDAASAHYGALTDPAACLTVRGEGAVSESVKDGPASSSLGGSSEGTHPPVRGRVLHLMKKTVTQCVAATLQNVHCRDVAAVTGDAGGPGTPVPVLGPADESYSRAARGQDKQPVQGERSAGSVLVITHECVIRELLQALCRRRFGNTIKAGSITVLDVYTRRSGNARLRTSIPSRNSKAWSWLTGYENELVCEESDQETGVRMAVEESDLDVDIEPSEVHLLGLPYKSAQLFASDERAEAVDALLSRVNCRVEVFNKRE